MELLEELETKLAKCIASLENVLNWIRQEIGPGNDELPPAVLKLVDPLFLVKTEDDALDLPEQTEDFGQGSPLSILELEENVLSGEEDQITVGIGIPEAASVKQYKCSHCAKEYASLEALSQHAVVHSRIYIPRIHVETPITKEAKKNFCGQGQGHAPKTPVKCFQCKLCGAEIPSASKIGSHIRLKHPNLANSIANTDAIVYEEPKQLISQNRPSNATKVSNIMGLDQGPTMQSRQYAENAVINNRFQPIQPKPAQNQTPSISPFPKPENPPPKVPQSNDNNKMKAHLMQIIPGPEGQGQRIQIIDNLTLVNPALPLFILSKDPPNKEIEQKRSPVPIPIPILIPKHKIHVKRKNKKVAEPKLPKIRKMTKCTMCDEEFTNELAYRKHLLNKHEGKTLPMHKCSKCSKEFKQLSMLERHRTLPNENCARPSKILCSLCGKMFRRDTLKCHINRSHRSAQVPKLQCKFCPKAFFYKDDIGRHESRHLGKFKKLCPHCGVPKTCLQSHIEYVHEGKRFKCKFCEAIIHQKGQIRPHLLLKHLDKVDQVSTSEAVTIIYVQPREMDQVQKKQAEGKPAQSRAKSVSVARKKISGSLFCSICSVNFSSRETQKVHQLRHERDPQYRHKPRLPVEELPNNSVNGSHSTGDGAIGNVEERAPS